MSDASGLRRKGSTARRYAPAALPPAGESAQHQGVSTRDVVTAGLVVIIAVALIGLIWLVTSRAIQDERGQITDAAEHTLAAQAAVLAQEISHELLMIDQSLRIIQAAWQLDSDKVHLDRWKETMPALLAVADDMFIADERHVIRQDVLPQAVSQTVGSGYVSLPRGAAELLDGNGEVIRERPGNDTALSVQSLPGSPIDVRQFPMYLILPLDHPLGWSVGAFYRSANLARMFARASLGFNSLMALVEASSGQLQAVVGPGARRPRTELAETAMYRAMSRSEASVWVGNSGIDGVERVHAFHRVPARDTVVVVAASTADLLASADGRIGGTRDLGCAAGGLVVVIAGLVLWGILSQRANQNRELAWLRTDSDRLRADADSNLARSSLQMAWLRALVDHGSDGVCLVDAGLRMAHWNARFARGMGVHPRSGQALDTLLREQAARGLFRGVRGTDLAIAQLMIKLRTGNGCVALAGPDGADSCLRGVPIKAGPIEAGPIEVGPIEAGPIEVGGFVLLLTGVSVVPTPPNLAPAGTETACIDLQ